MRLYIVPQVSFNLFQDNQYLADRRLHRTNDPICFPHCRQHTVCYFTFAVFVPACLMHIFTRQFPFLFRTYLATVSTNMVTYMWNTDRNAVIIRILGALEAAAAPPESAMQATRRCDGLSQRQYLHT